MAAAVGSCWVHLTSRHWTRGTPLVFLILILSLFPLGGEQTFSIAGVPSPDGKSAAWRLNSKGFWSEQRATEALFLRSFDPGNLGCLL